MHLFFSLGSLNLANPHCSSIIHAIQPLLFFHTAFTPFSNKQTIHTWFNHLMRVSFAQLTSPSPRFPFHTTLYSLSPSPHSRSCSSSCTPPPGSAVGFAFLLAASPPVGRTPPSWSTLHTLLLSHLAHDHQLLKAGHQQGRVHFHQRRVLQHLRSLLRFLAQVLVHSGQNLLQLLGRRSLQQSDRKERTVPTSAPQRTSWTACPAPSRWIAGCEPCGLSLSSTV